MLVSMFLLKIWFCDVSLRRIKYEMYFILYRVDIVVCLFYIFYYYNDFKVLFGCCFNF